AFQRKVGADGAEQLAQVAKIRQGGELIEGSDFIGHRADLAGGSRRGKPAGIPSHFRRAAANALPTDPGRQSRPGASSPYRGSDAAGPRFRRGRPARQAIAELGTNVPRTATIRTAAKRPRVSRGFVLQDNDETSNLA